MPLSRVSSAGGRGFTHLFCCERGDGARAGYVTDERLMRWCMLHDGVLGFRNGARDFHGGVCGLRGTAQGLSVGVRDCAIK